MSGRDLGKLRDSLLARSGGHQPPPDGFKRRATAHDALRSFAAKVQDWNCGVRAQLLGTLDLSGFGTMPNAFSARILVADRPFRRGDWIEAGEAKGTVEHVGIRSTRIRTGADSLMFIPNGKLADATVNNLGTRRHRVAAAKLLVAHGTGPDQLAAFMAGIGALLADIPHVQPSSVQVGVASINPEGIQVEVSCCLDVRSLADELADKTALMLGVLRLANRMRISLGGLNDATPGLGAAAAE